MESDLAKTDKDEDEDAAPTGGGIVRFTAGPPLWNYLSWLSKHTVLGKNPNEVAQQILVQRLSEMKAEDFKSPDKA